MLVFYLPSGGPSVKSGAHKLTTPMKNRERPESRMYFKIFEKNTIFNEDPVYNSSSTIFPLLLPSFSLYHLPNTPNLTPIPTSPVHLHKTSLQSHHTPTSGNISITLTPTFSPPSCRHTHFKCTKDPFLSVILR